MKLNMKILEAMPAGMIFHIVITTLQYEILPCVPAGGLVKFVACKSKFGMPDWAIYCGLVDHNARSIQMNGTKLLDEQYIKDICPCDDEAFKAYRG